MSKPRFARSYTGAKASRLLADFLSPSSSADKETRPALRTLRDRSRQLARNEPYANRAFELAQNCNEAMSKLAHAVKMNTKAIEQNGRAVTEMVNLLRAKVIQ